MILVRWSALYTLRVFCICFSMVYYQNKPGTVSIAWFFFSWSLISFCCLSGYQPCDPQVICNRVNHVSSCLEELKQLAAKRRAELEESRQLWAFFQVGWVDGMWQYRDYVVRIMLCCVIIHQVLIWYFKMLRKPAPTTPFWCHNWGRTLLQFLLFSKTSNLTFTTTSHSDWPVLKRYKLRRIQIWPWETSIMRNKQLSRYKKQRFLDFC